MEQLLNYNSDSNQQAWQADESSLEHFQEVTFSENYNTIFSWKKKQNFFWCKNISSPNNHCPLQFSQSQMVRDVCFGEGAKRLVLNYHMGALGQVKHIKLNIYKIKPFSRQSWSRLYVIQFLKTGFLWTGILFGLKRRSSLKISNKSLTEQWKQPWLQ